SGTASHEFSRNHGLGRRNRSAFERRISPEWGVRRLGKCLGHPAHHPGDDAAADTDTVQIHGLLFVLTDAGHSIGVGEAVAAD
ncbi:MAG TPA: hypothetical protein VIQ26_01605, partial [Microbacteriaceae bacterium]